MALPDFSLLHLTNVVFVPCFKFVLLIKPGCLLNVSVAYNITRCTFVLNLKDMLLTSNNNATRHRERMKHQAENKHKHYQRENSAASPWVMSGSAMCNVTNVHTAAQHSKIVFKF